MATTHSYAAYAARPAHVPGCWGLTNDVPLACTCDSPPGETAMCLWALAPADVPLRAPGKWMLFPSARVVDAIWQAISARTAAGRLGFAAKVHTRPDARTICPVMVYVDDVDATGVDAARVRAALEVVLAPFAYQDPTGLTLRWKTDAETAAGVRSGYSPGGAGAGGAPTPCRFWVRGACNEGARCRFLHGQVAAAAAAAPRPPAPPAPVAAPVVAPAAVLGGTEGGVAREKAVAAAAAAETRREAADQARWAAREAGVRAAAVADEERRAVEAADALARLSLRLRASAQAARDDERLAAVDAEARRPLHAEAAARAEAARVQAAAAGAEARERRAAVVRAAWVAGPVATAAAAPLGGGGGTGGSGGDVGEDIFGGVVGGRGDGVGVDGVGRGVDANVGAGWPCVACTFINAAVMPVCEMCHGARE